MKQIAIVEDDRFVREELQYRLEKAGYKTILIEDFSRTVEHIRQCMPDMLLLDLNIPEKNGFAVCKEIKETTSIPVLVLTSRDQLQDELQALSLGADEYLTKPCHGERLLARVQNVLKRYDSQRTLLEGGGMALDCQTDTLYAAGEVVHLTGQESTILEQLLSHFGEVVMKETLFQALWGTEEYIDENALQVAMTRLRKTLGKLAIEGKLVTIRGVGYKLEG